MTIPNDKRWIPKGMDISYTAKATSDVTHLHRRDRPRAVGPATTPTAASASASAASARDGVVVIEGVIKLWVTEKPAKLER